MLVNASIVGGWRKSSRSGPNCVEVALYRDKTAVRQSTNPTGPALLFTADEWAAFVGGVKDGEFDDLPS